MTTVSRGRHALLLLTGTVLALAPVLVRAQGVTVESPAALRLRVTTASEAAGREFWAGMSDVRNIFFSRATIHLDSAIALDRTLGIARVIRSTFAPGLTTPQRKAGVDSGLATMTTASTGELLTALAFRELVGGNAQQARAIFHTASVLLPGDPAIAGYAAQFGSGSPSATAAGLREVTEKFPDDAPSYNVLAYTLWQTGDHDGAFEAVRRYESLAPDQPNPHDSYAELLQWDNRFPEALRHYRRAVELDSNFTEAYMGMAEVLQLSGRGAEARQQIHQAITRAPATATRINYTRALAHSLLLDGKLRDAMQQLTAAARDAQADSLTNLAAGINREMAVADAFLGRGRDITAHLATAADLGGADGFQQVLATGIAQGTAGDVAAARRASAQLDSMAQKNSNFANGARVVHAVILLRENKASEAQDQLAEANANDPLVRALMAECYRATGNAAESRRLRSQVIDNPQMSLINPYTTFARVRAARIKA